MRDSKPSRKPGQLFNRREAGKAILTGVLGAAGGALYKVVESLALFEEAKVEGRFRAQDLAKDLFLPTSAFDLLPSRDHPSLPLGPDGFYPNQRHVVRRIRDWLGVAQEIVPQAYPPSVDTDWVVIGSSTSNLTTRSLMGSTHSPAFHWQGAGFRVHFPYSIANLSPRRKLEGLQAGVSYETEVCGIVDRNRNILAIPSTKDGRVTEDFLLVTRLPRVLSEHDVVIFAGLHSPAIYAIEKLILESELLDLQFLVHQLQGSHCFQAVFRVPSVHMAGDTLLPDSISLERSKSLGPVKVDVKIQHGRNHE